MSEHSPTILHVEDERPIRRFVRASLEGQGWRVLEAASRAEGRTMAATYAPDAIILDLALPDGDGKSLIREIREWSTTPIIVVSARDPGVKNWLDTAGYLRGVVQGRWTGCDSQPIPEVRKMKIGRVRDALPKDVAVVTPRERERIVRERRRALQERRLW